MAIHRQSLRPVGHVDGTGDASVVAGGEDLTVGDVIIVDDISVIFSVADVTTVDLSVGVVFSEVGIETEDFSVGVVSSVVVADFEVFSVGVTFSVGIDIEEDAPVGVGFVDIVVVGGGVVDWYWHKLPTQPKNSRLCAVNLI